MVIVGPVPARVEAEALVHRFGEGEGLERGARLPAGASAERGEVRCDVAKSRPPAMARTWPVAGSIATSAAPGSPGVGRCDSTRLRRRPGSRGRGRSSPRGLRRRRPPIRSAATGSPGRTERSTRNLGRLDLRVRSLLESDGDPRRLGASTHPLPRPRGSRTAPSGRGRSPPELGVERVIDRIVGLGGGEDARERRGLGDREAPRRHTEIRSPRRLDPVRAVAEVHRVQVLRQDRVLLEGAFDLDREEDLARAFSFTVRGGIT